MKIGLFLALLERLNVCLKQHHVQNACNNVIPHKNNINAKILPLLHLGSKSTSGTVLNVIDDSFIVDSTIIIVGVVLCIRYNTV